MGKISAIVNRVQHPGARQTALELFNALIHPVLLDSLKVKLPLHRQRLFPPLETLAMFISQVLSADGSCWGAVDQGAVQRLIGGLRSGSTATGGYCQGRARLPLALIVHLALATAKQIEARLLQGWHWHGRRVRLIDGTTAVMPNTAANQAAYPPERNQKPGLGFPICRSVGVFDLASGALVGAANRRSCKSCSIISRSAMCYSASGASMPSLNNRAHAGARPIFAAANGLGSGIT